MPPPRFSNVVLVTIDTLRVDHLSSYGYRRKTSPFISQIARRGARFTNVRATISHTAPSHASMFTGLMPTQHGLLENGQRLDASLPTLAQRFGEAGYRTGAFLSTTFLTKVAPGFETVDGSFRRCIAVVDSALDWLGELRATEPFFLWVHFFDVHRWEGIEGGQIAINKSRFSSERPSGESSFLDYVADLHGLSRTEDGRWSLPPSPLADGEEAVHDATAADREAEFLDIVDRYDARIAYVDSQIARLAEAIQTRSDAATLWVVTADHGEGLGSHDYWGHVRNIYDEQLRVPLIFAASDRSLPASVIEAPSSLLDLYPTLTEMLDGGASERDSARGGISLWPWILEPSTPAPERSIVAERRPVHQSRDSQDWVEEDVASIVRGHYKYIRHADGEDEFFDLRSDPRELNNRISSGSAVSVELERALRAELERAHSTRRGSVDEDYAEDTAVMEELRALGYVE